MMERTIIDVEGDAATVERMRQVLILVGKFNPDKEKSPWSDVAYYLAKGANNLVYQIIGAKGYFD